ncbi:leucine-rich repeat domain-containing protein [Nonomuraea sp. NPDC050663]|uniref:leucine-rich repeat domain-containing protein n=1 Tax=Nonomuraea sp. NPDC050663 TaxID=3364370 RepID=UPI0037A25D30
MDLSSLGLEALPGGLGNLTALTHLHLYGNQLTSLPDGLGNLTNLTHLHLYGNQLTSLPDSLGNLTALTHLHLDSNQLTSLPDGLGNLTNLTHLHLDLNQLTSLPEWLGNLTALTTLHIHGNQLTSLPDSLGNLTALTNLALGENQLTSLPEWLGNLTALTTLHIHGNQLTSLPEWLGNLTNLTTLHLGENRLTSLPDSLGNLTTLTLGSNPVLSPPPEICALGQEAVLAFLRGLQRGDHLPRTSKMVVVGQAEMGKTSVSEALCGRPFVANRPTTHGVLLDSLQLPHPDHPDHPGDDMRLNIWDFGGQLHYRATQRFYLTDRSLFLLVWNARRDWRTDGQLEPWLETITNAAPHSPIIVVATRCATATPNLDAADLRARYPQIRQIAEVDCEDGRGIDHLRDLIAAEAAQLPLMAQRWPLTWAAAMHELGFAGSRWISTEQSDDLMAACRMSEGERIVLRAALHDRGDILHYAREPELRDRVILQPAWVDEMITRVLDSRQVIDRHGLLSRGHRAELWRDLKDPGLWDMLTALMERFDLAYRLDAPGHDDVALVVERLPAGAPVLPPEWEQLASTPGVAEVNLTYRLPSRQAGIPTWFIAREHRYTTGVAWQRGVLLRHHDHAAGPGGDGLRSMALLVDDGGDRPVLRLCVRGPHPHTFYSILDEAFTGIVADRYPGLQLQRCIPCTCSTAPEPPCEREFAYDDAHRALERQAFLQCPRTFAQVDPRTLLFGLRPLRLEQALHGLAQCAEDLRHDLVASHSDLREGLGQLARTTSAVGRGQIQLLDQVRDLLRYRGEQVAHCPSIFTVTKTGALSYELRLYCEHPEQPHPLDDGAGVYELKSLPPWLRRYAPYLKGLLTAVRLAASVAAPFLAGVGITLPEETKAQIEASSKLLDSLKEPPESQGLPELEAASRQGGQQPAGQRPVVNLAELRQALVELDPAMEWGGLREREWPESRSVVYLCQRHRHALRYPAETPEA